MNILILLLMIIATLLGGLGAYFLKKGSSMFSFNIRRLLKNWPVFAGLLSYALSMVIFLYALQYAQLSLLYPLVSLSYVWVIIFSAAFLKEKINSYKILGIISILIGIVFITLY
ncbi:MAG: EamA family transporter [Nanoarchaeota archaeon]